MSITINLTLTAPQAYDLAELVKRLCRRSLGRDDLTLVTAEETEAESAVIALRDALEAAGFAPR